MRDIHAGYSPTLARGDRGGRKAAGPPAERGHAIKKSPALPPGIFAAKAIGSAYRCDSRRRRRRRGHLRFGRLLRKLGCGRLSLRLIQVLRPVLVRSQGIACLVRRQVARLDLSGPLDRRQDSDSGFAHYAGLRPGRRGTRLARRSGRRVVRHLAWRDWPAPPEDRRAADCCRLGNRHDSRFDIGSARSHTLIRQPLVSGMVHPVLLRRVIPPLVAVVAPAPVVRVCTGSVRSVSGRAPSVRQASRDRCSCRRCGGRRGVAPIVHPRVLWRVVPPLTAAVDVSPTIARRNAGGFAVLHSSAHAGLPAAAAAPATARRAGRSLCAGGIRDQDEDPDGSAIQQKLVQHLMSPLAAGEGGASRGRMTRPLLSTRLSQCKPTLR